VCAYTTHPSCTYSEGKNRDLREKTPGEGVFLENRDGGGVRIGSFQGIAALRGIGNCWRIQGVSRCTRGEVVVISSAGKGYGRNFRLDREGFPICVQRIGKRGGEPQGHLTSRSENRGEGELTKSHRDAF